MKTITYATEKRIDSMKKMASYERTSEQNLAIQIWDNIFSSCGYYGGTLKELEEHLQRKLSNERQEQVLSYTGIHGLEYKTNGNVRYIGTNDLSYVNIEDFNKWVKTLG